MKLPRYDNSPPPGAPLYSNPADQDDNWVVLKGAMSLLVAIAGIAAIGWGIFSALQAIL